ncbi:MAG: tryptophanase [Petrimonas sp.]|jgi:tryptophanase|uniref:tryptophanase n=1 Tax=Dysgonomonadaceae TaxID=2005520 RepID=UPI000E9D9AC8|nr:tryptophanase [Proteiniphilum sp. UBA5346]MDD2311324.1 tryptophanase [Petrimonas sp.]NLU29323.1 tryptophanase [Bacteroidales bacterium]BBD45480.1 tryptophanase [Petrimonas sp. IBARAKI]HBF95725.1 tryptophanase [Porphyromonadaceae bacterium]MDD3543504.1 tryptophanase [Petrimonas sp.]
MQEIKFYNGENIPLELHKVRVVQKLHLVPIERRLEALEEGGFNTFRLNTKDVFLDMLTDSGTNAMSDNQMAAMMQADDAYAGSQSFYRLKKAVEDVLGKKHYLPVHQGRAAENILSKAYIKQGSLIPMNYHFTTTLAHITECGGRIVELLYDEGYVMNSDHPFKGNMNIEKLEENIIRHGSKNVPFIRMEASTNLIGGQPFSIQNLRDVRAIADKYNIRLVLDASLLGENAYLVKLREEEFNETSMADILKTMTELADIVYFSARKLSSSRGGGICTNSEVIYKELEALVPLYEGFLTYGGISVREIESMAVGLYETLDETMICQSPDFIRYLVDELDKNGVPMLKPAGVLGAHVNAMELCSHIPQTQYPAGSLAAALFLISGIRGMERGSVSNQRDEYGNETYADMELVRLAVPRRVFTLSQIKYVIDRVTWLNDNRELIGGLKFVYEPPVLRFFMGGLEPVNDWPQRLISKFKEDFGESL